MQKSDAARIIAGLTPAETKQSSAPTSVHVMSGEVVGNSESGKVQIRMDGDVVSPDDDQIIEVDAIGGLEEGDTATILLTGQPGRAMTPMAMGSSGSVDRIVERIKTIEADYVKATEIEAEVGTFGYLKAADLEAEVAEFGYLKANELEAEVAEFGYLKADDLEAEVAEFGYLKANSATITDLQADTAKIHNLSANDISAATGYIHDLTSSNVTAQNIIADHGDFSTVKANAAKVANLTAQELEADHATIANLDTSYAQIDMANVNNAWIANGLIKDAAIKSEMVESISANQLTAGEIDADEITVRNLKASSLTVQTADGYVYVGDKRIPTKEFIDSLKDELQNEIDGAIETFTVSAVPTLSNTPANDWVVSGDAEATRKLRAKHVGDIAYVVNSSSAQNGYCYRFAYDATNQEFKWVLIKDSDVTAALSRLSTAEGKITGLETFESNTTSWIEETDEGLETIRTNHTNLAGIVDKTVVETKQLWFTKANTTAPNKPTAAVTSTSTAGNAWRVVVPAWNASYPNYYYCLQYKLADGTYAWSDVVRDIAMGESQQQGRKGVADAATADGKAVSAQNTANANIKSSVQLWFTKANSTAPDKPSAQVTTNSASTANAWNLAIPTYNSSYPHYFYCYQQQKGDGTYQWSDVVYDRSVTEAQAKAQAALPSSAFTTFQSTTFKNLVDTVEEQSSTITQLSDSVSSVGNILTGNVANPSNWIISAPSGASYTKEAYGTAGVKVTFNSVGGYEWLYSQPIAVTSGNKYMVFFDYTVGKAYTSTSGKMGYGLAAYSGSNAPSGTYDDANTRFLGKAEFPKTASEDRVLKGSFTFTATSDSIILGLNGGHIADNQTGLSFTIDNLVVGETLSTTSTTINSVKQTADSNSTYLANLTTTLGTNADGTSKSEDIVHKYNQLDQTLDGTVTRVGTTETNLENLTNRVTQAETSIEQNKDAITLGAQKAEQLMTFVPMKHTRDDTWFWYSLPATSFTYLDDGWAHYEYTNSTSSAVSTYIAPKSWGQVIPGEQYTFLLEIKNYSGYSGTGQFAYMQEMVGAQFWGTGVVSANGVVKTTRISYNDFDENGAFTKRFVKLADTDHIGDGTTYDGLCFRYRFYIAANTTLSLDIRISVYPGDYEGPYNEYLTATAGAQLKVASDAIDLRVEKNDVINQINVSTEGATIHADRVNIEGAAIFTSGRLSSTSLNNSYDAKGSASTAETNAKAYTDSMEIGGRNLLKNTKNPAADHWPMPVGDGITWGGCSKLNLSFEDGIMRLVSTATSGEHFVRLNSPVYTQRVHEAMGVDLHDPLVISGYVRATIAESDSYITFRTQASNGTSWFDATILRNLITGEARRAGSIPILNASSSEWVRFEVCATISESVAAVNQYFSFQQYGTFTVGDTIEFKLLKLERGNKATDWSPAPEDTVARTQRIYYRKSSTGAPTEPSAWITTGNNGENYYNQWTTKVPPIASGTGASLDKYAYLYTCEQRQMVDGTLEHTTILLDENTTVIDGGTIITGSLSANSIDATSGTFNTANIPNLSAAKITSGNIAAARIKTNVISAINSLTAGQIDAARINVGEISIGQSQVSGLSTALAGKETAGAAAAVQENLDALSSGITWMGICSTAAGTAAKDVVCEGFGADDLKTGATICVRFASANTVSNAITLNVNGTGAKTISAAQAVTSDTNYVLWASGSTIRFYYNGTYWRIADTPPTYYGTCSTAAGTAAKTSSVSGAVIFAGTVVNLNMTNANTNTSATLNVSSTGAKAIYYGTSTTRPTTSNGYGWHAAETAPFVFDGRYWRYTNSMTSYQAVQSAKTASNYIYASSDGIKIANASPSSATTYQLQTASGTDFVVAGAVRNRINGNGMTLYDGNGVADSNIVAYFAANLVELGKGSTDAVIKFCNGMGSVSYDADTQFLQFMSPRLSNYAKSDDGTTTAASQLNAHFKTGETDGVETANTAGVSSEAAAGYATSSLGAYRHVSGGDPMIATVKPYATGTEGRIEFYANSFIFSGPGISGGGQAIKAIYADSTVVQLSNGKWLSLANATVVAQKLGSGASQGNTVCIAQNGGYESYTGVVTGAMGSDGGARAYIYPNHTGYIRINFILIRFA